MAALLVAAKTFGLSVAAATGAEEHEKHRRYVQDLRKRYEDHPSSYHKFPISKIAFKVGKDVTGNPRPVAYFDGHKGLIHLTPWACAYYGYLDTYGDRGQKTKRDRDSLSKCDLALAQQLVVLTSYQLHEYENENYQLLGYFEWVEEVEGVLTKHIQDRAKQYRNLGKASLEAALEKGAVTAAGDDVRLARLPTIKKHYASPECPVVEYSDLHATRKVFVPSTGAPGPYADGRKDRVATLVRQQADLYQLDGSVIPKTDQLPIVPGDIVSAMIKVAKD